MSDANEMAPAERHVRVAVDEARRVVQIKLPPFAEMTDDQAKAALEDAIRVRKEWEAKGYEVRY